MNYNCKLSEEQKNEVAYFCRLGADKKVLAKGYDVSLALIQQISSRHKCEGKQFFEKLKTALRVYDKSTTDLETKRKIEDYAFRPWAEKVTNSINPITITPFLRDISEISSRKEGNALHLYWNLFHGSIGLMHQNKRAYQDLLNIQEDNPLAEQERELFLHGKEVNAEISDVFGAIFENNFPYIRSSIKKPYKKQAISASDLHKMIKQTVANRISTKAYKPLPQSLQSILLSPSAEDIGFREVEILKVRYGSDGSFRHTLDETARKMGLSRKRVRQIEERTMLRLRRIAKREGYDTGSYLLYLQGAGLQDIKLVT